MREDFTTKHVEVERRHYLAMAMRGNGQEVEARSTGSGTKHFPLFNQHSTDHVRAAAYGLSRH